MKWLKKNWIYIVLIGLIGYLLINDAVKINSHKREIKAVSDSLVVLERDYQELEKAADISAELVAAYEFAALAYQDSLKDTKQEIINQKQRHAKQVADLIRMPSDVLYVDLKHWLDTIKFE